MRATKRRNVKSGAADAHERAKDMAQANVGSGELPIAAQQRVVKNYRDGQPWPPTLGPPPGATGCKIRPEVLAEFGFRAPLSGRAAA